MYIYIYIHIRQQAADTAKDNVATQNVAPVLPYY